MYSEQTILSIAGIVIGFTGAAIGIWQTLAARRARDLYEEKCLTRCKDVFEMISSLSDHVNIACKEINSDLFFKATEASSPHHVSIPIAIHVSILKAKLDSIMTLTWQLIRFCKRLDEEHQREFKKPAISSMSYRLRRLQCVAYGRVPEWLEYDLDEPDGREDLRYKKFIQQLVRQIPWYRRVFTKKSFYASIKDCPPQRFQAEDEER